jgi:hypothetical protein
VDTDPAVPAGVPGAAIPFAGQTIIALGPEQFAAIRRTVELLFGLTRSPAYQAHVDRDAEELLRFAPGNTGVFMGYDFHLAPDGPRLIEINTNAGGALLNGLHTAALCDPRRLRCLCEDLLPVDAMVERIVGTFRAELAAGRGSAAPLRQVAITDERPEQQFLYPEFQLMAQLLERAGIGASICDTAELQRSAGALWLGQRRVDLVYLRDTDFTLGAPRSAALRAAYLEREVVVTPAPREHHLLANKRRLVLFSSPDWLESLGVPSSTARFLERTVPRTLSLAELGAERAWRERDQWVFKPADSFGSRAVYRGDKISRRKLEEISRDPRFLAQRRVEPGLLQVETSEGPRAMKFDVRAYAYRDQVLLLGARVYQGQVTNLRTTGGGFSAICVARAGQSGACAPPGGASAPC